MSVGVTVLQVELAQQLPIEVHAVRIVDAGALQKVEPALLRSADNVAQLSIAEGIVADEVDALHLRRLALRNLKHEVHAILLQLDDLGLDRSGVASLPPVDIEDSLHVRLHSSARKDRARLEMYLVDQRFGINLAVALEGDLADDRVLDNRHVDGAAVAIDLHVGEQTGGE